jgi:hypothetical protein
VLPPQQRGSAMNRASAGASTTTRCPPHPHHHVLVRMRTRDVGLTFCLPAHLRVVAGRVECLPQRLASDKLPSAQPAPPWVGSARLPTAPAGPSDPRDTAMKRCRAFAPCPARPPARRALALAAGFLLPGAAKLRLLCIWSRALHLPLRLHAPDLKQLDHQG